MSIRWHYKVFGEVFGPVENEELQELIAVGTLSQSDDIRAEGSAHWVSVSTFNIESARGPSQDDSSSIQELTDLSELNFEFEENVELPEIESAAPVPSEAESPAPASSAGEQVESHSHEPEYFYEAIGQELGPMPMHELILLAKDGALTGNDKVRLATSAEWMSPIQIPELASVMESVANAEPATSPINEDSTGNASAAADSSAAAIPRSAARKNNTNTNPAKRRKKRKKKHDPLLEEIFREISTGANHVQSDAESGQTLSEPSNSQSATTETTPQSASGNPVAADASQEPPIADTPSASNSPKFTPPPEAPSQPAPQIPAYSPPVATQPFRPTPSRKKKTGSSFSMPSSRTLGILAGVVVVAAAGYAFMTGSISMPQGNVDSAGLLAGFCQEYKTMSAGTINPEQWKAFRAKVRPDAARIITHIAKNPNSTEQERKYRIAAFRLTEMVNTDLADKEFREELLGEILELTGGGG